MGELWLALGVIATGTLFLHSGPVGWAVTGLVLIAGSVTMAIGARGQSRAGLWPILGTAVLLAPTVVGVAHILGEGTVVRWETLQACCRWLSFLTVFTSFAWLGGQSREQHRRLLAAMAGIGTAICGISTIQAFTSGGLVLWIWEGSEPQVFGPFLSRNNFASFALLVLPLAVYCWYRTKDWYWLAGIGVVAGSVVASGSRAGALLLGFELLVLAIAVLGRRSWLMLAATAAGVAICGWSQLAGKLGQSDPFLYRREMALAAAEMVGKQPATGLGVGSFALRYPAFAKFDSGHYVNHAHNEWLELSSEFGIPIAVGLAILVGGTGMRWRRAPWALGVGVAGLHGLVDYPFQRLGVMFWVMALAALALAKAGSESGKRPDTINGF